MRFFRKTPAKNNPPGSLSDAAMGCLLGACIGDAAGATLEFLGRKPALAEVDLAMIMPGGGKLKVAPGQITDDGELILCLTQGLLASGSFQLEAVARRYANWVRSFPFDMGFTIRRSLACFHDHFAFFDEGPKWQSLCEERGYAVAMTDAASEFNSGSKANGSLMRISPLGIFGRGLREDKLAQIAQADSRLSHPNDSCCHAVSCYVIAIASLMNNLGDRKKAFRRSQTWARKHANEEVNQWLADASNSVDVPCHPHAGFVRIAFTHAFRHLVSGSGFVEALRETLLGGGDTDTNACIVGGLVGAACGADSIPEHMKAKVINCNTEGGSHPRPAFLRAKQIPGLVERLISTPGSS